MANQVLRDRLAGIQKALVALRDAGGGMSSSTKGHEREGFINEFLRAYHPPMYRFGTGNIIDAAGARSGQLDVVVEYPFAPSVTTGGDSNCRLYLAESVAAAIEIKSDLSGQWNEVLGTATALAKVKRAYTGGMMNVGGINTAIVQGTIPLFAVGYSGWATLETVQKYAQTPGIDGVLVVDKGLFAASTRLGGTWATGAWSLWGMIAALHEATRAVGSTTVDVLSYTR